MAVLQVVVVARPIQVGGHHAGVARAVLRIKAFAQLDAGNLGQGVRLVGWLQRASEQILFFDGLRAITWVNAARTQKHQIVDASTVSPLNQVGLHHQVLVDEVGTVGVVGMNTPHLGCSDEQIVGLFGLQKSLYLGLARQVKLGMRAGDDVLIAVRLEAANNGRTHHATMTSHVNLVACVLHVLGQKKTTASSRC